MFDPTKKVKGVVDIVFLVDATGSMGNCINGLKERIGTFFDSLTMGEGNRKAVVPDWRAKVVGYRDFEEDGAANWLVNHDFTTDKSVLKRQLADLEADGGGDIPESLLDAIYTVATMPESANPQTARPDEWRERHVAARAIIAFTDAPFKEPMSAPGCAGGTKEDVREVLQPRRIMLTLVGQKCPGDSCFQWAGTMSKGQYIPVDSLENFGDDNVEMDKLLARLGKTLSQTMGTETL